MSSSRKLGSSNVTATTDCDAKQLLTRYRLPGHPLFIIGTFDSGITVLSQQVRALNLAWALVESGEIPMDRPPDADLNEVDMSRKRIAVVGAGFAGLTIAAGLLKKRVNADITIFERRDTVLPLQHGSDSRWLHPHIYDWPSRGSESFSAALPVLNWTASRASDVVVQVLKEWADVAGNDQPPLENTTSDAPTLKVFCNTRHIQVAEDSTEPGLMTVEWIGEQRDKSDPAIPARDVPTPVGSCESFHIVVLAVGFGLESGSHTPYWRNETLAQPDLGQARSTYIVSGAGDGAMIDMFRLRISQFRQDRILADLFSGHENLLKRLRDVHESSSGGVGFETFRNIWEDKEDEPLAASASKVQVRLRDLLRQDTAVLLRVREPSFTGLFDGKRVSFQNRLLAYLLYRCGAFTLVTAATDADLRLLADEYGVPPQRIIVRHGTDKEASLSAVVADGLKNAIHRCFENPGQYLQDDTPRWRGGYFDMPGLSDAADCNGQHVENTLKGHWRKEYLPSPMEAIATALCSTVAGFVADVIRTSSRLRVTLHRTLIFGNEVVLQQCCEYQGIPTPGDRRAGRTPPRDRRAGRTFPSRNGTIGAAFDLQGVVRTKTLASKPALNKDMASMHLNVASQAMADEVASVAAIPFLGPARSDSGHDRIVIGVLYLDSYDENAFVDDEMLDQVIHMCNSFLAFLPLVSDTATGRIANTEFWRPGDPRDVRSHASLAGNWEALEQLSIDTPRSDSLRHLNFDFSDFTPVEEA